MTALDAAILLGFAVFAVAVGLRSRRAASRGIIPKARADRAVSRLNKRLNATSS